MAVVEGDVERESACHHITLVEHIERSLYGGVAVAVLSWPDEQERVHELRRRGVPRMLVIGSSDDPVMPPDDLEDWIRIPADDRDVRTRLLRLRDHAERAPLRPVLDGAGRMLFAGGWVGLSIVEERLAAVLVERFGQVVAYDELIRAGWPAGHKDKTVLRPRISGLRRRVATLGLELRSVREVGHVLEPAGRPASS